MRHQQLDLGFQVAITSNPKTKRYCDTVKETIQYYSVDQTSLRDLLAVIIGRKATPELCHELASLSMKELSEKSAKDFQTDYGVSPSVSMTLVAAIGLAKKIAFQSGCEERVIIRTPKDAADLMMPKMRHLAQEHFVCLFLDSKSHVIGEDTIFIGGLNSAIVHPREVYKNALKRSSASILCLHNHPSGSIDPSREDIEVTKRLAEAGRLMGIELLDHVIIGDGVYCSLREKGIL